MHFKRLLSIILFSSLLIFSLSCDDPSAGDPPTTVEFTIQTANTGYITDGENTSQTNIWMGRDENGTSRGIISFDTSTLPDGASIKKVELDITSRISNGDPFQSSRYLYGDIANGNFNDDAALEVEDTDAAAGASDIFTTNITSYPGEDTTTTLSLKSSAFQYVDTAGTTQIRLAISNDGGLPSGAEEDNNTLSFYDEFDTDYDPILRVSYSE